MFIQAIIIKLYLDGTMAMCYFLLKAKFWASKEMYTN